MFSACVVFISVENKLLRHRLTEQLLYWFINQIYQQHGCVLIFM